MELWERGKKRKVSASCEKQEVSESTVVLFREYGSTLYVGLARAVSPTNTNFWLTFLLTRLQEALINFEVYHHFSGL